MIGSCHGLICNCLEELWKPRNTLVRMDHVQADILNQHVWNTKQ
jgi:hypothetical protein